MVSRPAWPSHQPEQTAFINDVFNILSGDSREVDRGRFSLKMSELSKEVELHSKNKQRLLLFSDWPGHTGLFPISISKPSANQKLEGRTVSSSLSVFPIANIFFIPSSPALLVADEPARSSIGISDWSDPPVGPEVHTCHWEGTTTKSCGDDVERNKRLHTAVVLQRKKEKKKMEGEVEVEENKRRRKLQDVKKRPGQVC